MANAIVERVYWTAFGDPVMKAVFVALADQANGQAFCWPSVDTIIERTEYGERTVRQKLKKLVDEGWIRQRLRPGHSSQYLINLPRLATERAPRHDSREKGVWEEANQLDELKRKFAERELEEPSLFKQDEIPPARGAGDSNGVEGRGAGDSQGVQEIPSRGASPAPRTVTEPSIEPSIVLGENDFTSNSEMVDWFAERWNRFAEDNPAVQSIRLPISDERRDKIIKRTLSSAKGQNRKRFWEEFFSHLEGSRFLKGLVPPTGNYTRPFSLKMNWALLPKNFNEVMDGGYERSIEDSPGRHRGSAMAAADRFAARVDASGLR